jgi:hypothetical protein
MHLALRSIALSALLGSGSALHAGGEACQAAQTPPVIELAICLDTSGSMNGLIDSARARIWDLVSDLALATPQPKLRVAIVQFGNDGLSQESGWTRVEADLTDDLDLVSRTLFAFTTGGGTEFVGRAVDTATTKLSWTQGEGSMRIVVVAGNESADQDQEVRFADACRRAIEQGIVVNSIYCGPADDALAPDWRQVALLADGHFASIDQNSAIVAIPTPFDAELAALNERLNATYLAYGERGAWAQGNQIEQDGNAATMGGQVAAQRCVTKASGLYDNRSWDLVDACRDPAFTLDSIPVDQLPEAMRALSPEGRRAFVAARAEERAKAQAIVAELAAKREVFLAEARARDAAAGRGLDAALREAIRAQARQRGFAFPEPAASPPAASAAAAGAG